jgi:hypothetical protein
LGRLGFMEYVYLLIPGFVLLMVLKIFELGELIKASPSALSRVGRHTVGPDFTSLVSALKKVDAIGDEVLATLSVRHLRKLLLFLDGATTGRVEIGDPVEMMNLPVELMKGVESSLSATLFWQRDHLGGKLGEAYRTEMADAIKRRKVRIRRIFVIPQGAIDDAQLQSRMRDDRSLGVEVKYITETDWLNHDGGAGVQDFGVWDKSKVWLYKESAGAQKVALLTVNKIEVDQYDKLFDAKWLISTDPE